MASVGLDLGFPRSAQAHAPGGAASPSAGLPGQVSPQAGEPWQAVLVLGQCYLQLSLPCERVLSENVQDERGTVDDLAIQRPFHLSLLTRRQLIVEEEHVNTQLIAMSFQLLHLALANEGCWMDASESLVGPSCHLDASRVRQSRQLFQRILNGKTQLVAPVRRESV